MVALSGAAIMVPVLLMAAAGAEGAVQSKTNVGTVVGELVRKYLPNCRLAVLSDDISDEAVDDLSYALDDQLHPRVIMQLDDTPADKSASAATLIHQMLNEQDHRSLCVAFLIHGSTPEALDFALSALEEAELFMHPHKYLLWLGPEDRAHEVLGNNTLRNTANVLYIAIQPAKRSRSSLELLPVDPAPVIVTKILTRCLYCNSGDPSIYRLHVWRPESGFRPGIPLFRDQLKQFYGHTFRVMTLSWFPFVELKENPEDPDGPLLPVDSLDTRIAAAMAEISNFTAAYSLPDDGAFGYATPTGNWTGIVGKLQYYQTDFSNVLSVTEGRSQVVDFSVSYPGEPIVMILSAPRPLPQWTALMRPFEVETWVVTLVSVSIVGMVLYLLQKGWSWVSGQPGLRLDVAFLQAWAIILEDPPTNQPTNASGQMIIGWWWVYCMLITIVYKSALTSHLTIPGKSPTIDSFEQLLAQDGWTWGTEPSYGSGWNFFKSSTNPTISAIFKGLEVAKFDEHMKRVFAGNHAFLSWKYYVKYNLAARYGDAFGNTPTYKAQEETVIHTGYSWGFRRGAPFRRRFDQLMLRLLQAGLIEHWLDELIITRARHERNVRREKEAKEGDTSSNMEVQEEVDENVILSLHHLQGAFYILMIGGSLSLIVLGMEIVLHVCKSKTTVDLGILQ